MAGQYQATDTDADGGYLVPRELSDQMIENVRAQSGVMSACQRVGQWNTMNKPKIDIPKIGTLAASWVDEAGAKPTDAVAFSLVDFDAKKIALIAPYTDEFMDDTGEFGMTARLQAEMEAAFALLFDQSALGYVVHPLNDDLTTAATGHAVAFGTGVDLAEDLSSAMSNVEAHNFVPNGWICPVSLRHSVRNLRDTNNALIYGTANVATGQNVPTIWDVPTDFTTNMIQSGSPAAYEAIVGDFRYCQVGVYQQMTYKILEEATLTLTGGGTLNLAQQDAKAIRLVMRIAFCVYDNDAFAKVTGL